MMNVLTDILCDTSPMMTPQSFKGTLPQNKLSQHDVSSKQGTLLLDSVSQIPNISRPLSSINHSSPSNINIFNSSDQIHIPSNIDSGFEDRSGVSVFSDSFPEIVPSWLAHDFMKVSDNLASPNILSNVTDIYSTNRENEHLEMLDLGFTPDLTSQDVPSSINRSCIDDSQKLLGNLPMQRFSNHESLIIPTFNDIHNTHLHISMNKNNIQYQKFKQNGPDVNSAQSIMNAVLPCENELLHLPLPSSLSEQCLNSSSSPSMISSSQSQSHPVDVVCDKLPQINLNHLDSLLGNETTLSDIQLLRHDFPNVRLSEDGCTPHSNTTCLDTYNPNGGLIPCDTSNILGPNVSSLSQSQDASVQVSVNLISEHNVPDYGNCYSCSEIPSESPIEVVQCFKCKFCDFVSIHKCAVASHINVTHSKPHNTSSINKHVPNDIRSDNLNSLPIGGHSETHFNNSDTMINTNVSSVLNNAALISDGNAANNNEKYPCIQCNIIFANINDFNSHLLSNHNGKSNHIQLNPTTNSTVSYQLIPINSIVINAPTKKDDVNFLINNNMPQSDNKNSKRKLYPKKDDINFLINNVSNMPQSDVNKNSKRKIYPKKDDVNFLINNVSNMLSSDVNKNLKRKIYPKKQEDIQKKNQAKKTPVESTVGNEKNISSHKKAWQKKMRRELGSYICEFKGCNVRFRALDNLEYHRKCHTLNGSAFECPECRMSFDSWGAIAGHLWRSHGNDMELHACDQCPFRTYSLSRLENLHKRIHKDECLFLCDTCGKSFKNGKQLRNHRVVHIKSTKPKQGGGDFKCNICLKGFAFKRLLRMHQSTVHNKIKPFVCNYCDYSASSKSTMTLHMRQHTGEKPFKCDTCEYRTSDHNSLRRHKMTHSGDKKYKCPYCSYSCIQAHLYKVHLKKHPGGNDGLVFSCNVCSFKTIKQDTYLMHISEHDNRHRSSGENAMTEMQSTDELFPLAEAMDISLSQSDNLLSNLNKDKHIQSFFNGLNINLVSVAQQSAN